MRAADVMTRNPQAVTPDMTVADAVRIMQTEHCGIVPVVTAESERTVVGLVTDRDIALRACQPGAEGPSAAISSVMTTNLFCVSPDDDISRVCEVMQSAGVRRIPVVEDGERLLGIISMRDLADQLRSEELGQTDDKILSQEPNN